MAYATVAEVRALPDLSDDVTYPDALLQEGIDVATDTINTYCIGPAGSFAPAPFRVVTTGAASGTVWTGVPGIRSLTKVILDGAEVEDLSGWRWTSTGLVFMPALVSARHEVVVEGEAGLFDVAPPAIRWACRTLAAQYAKDLASRIPDRATQVQSDFGQVNIAQAGGPGRPTSLPDVNAVLVRYRVRGYGF